MRQLATEVEFLRHCEADRFGVAAPDVNQVVGAAALVFSAAGGDPAHTVTARREQVADALALLRACSSSREPRRRTSEEA